MSSSEEKMAHNVIYKGTVANEDDKNNNEVYRISE